MSKDDMKEIDGPLNEAEWFQYEGKPIVLME